jgi:hypothetical protein
MSDEKLDRKKPGQKLVYSGSPRANIGMDAAFADCCYDLPCSRRCPPTGRLSASMCPMLTSPQLLPAVARAPWPAGSCRTRLEW